MFYDFIYLAKGFRMRPKVRSTLKQSYHKKKSNLLSYPTPNLSYTLPYPLT